MKYFIDTEFHEYERLPNVSTIDLISIGIVAEDGREFYRVSSDFDVYRAYENKWLHENVLGSIYRELSGDTSPHWGCSDLYEFVIDKGTPRAMLATELVEGFIGDDEEPQFYGYYADYDWVVFCWLFGRMISLPKHFPMYCRDLKQTMDDYVALRRTQIIAPLTVERLKRHPDYPKQTDEHNALADARWHRSLYIFLANQLQEAAGQR
jgi:hypothetical protein